MALGYEDFVFLLVIKHPTADVNLSFAGVAPDAFKSNYQDNVTMIVSQLSGVPKDLWNTTVQQQQLPQQQQPPQQQQQHPFTPHLEWSLVPVAAVVRCLHGLYLPDVQVR